MIELSAFKSYPFLIAVANGIKWGFPRFLVEAVLIAGVTMYGTQMVMTEKIEALRNDVKRLTILAEEARRVQLEIVPMRNLQVKTLQEAVEKHEARIVRLERRR